MVMKTRITAAALCCLLLTACDTLADRFSDLQRERDLNQQYGQLSDALKYREAHK
jgi:outer membrane biogenesis lipoprotein LolB